MEFVVGKRYRHRTWANNEWITLWRMSPDGKTIWGLGHHGLINHFVGNADLWDEVPSLVECWLVLPFGTGDTVRSFVGEDARSRALGFAYYFDSGVGTRLVHVRDDGTSVEVEL